jgi:hypothetical protein
MVKCLAMICLFTNLQSCHEHIIVLLFHTLQYYFKHINEQIINMISLDQTDRDIGINGVNLEFIHGIYTIIPFSKKLPFKHLCI